jgi:hypothetical protein
VAAADVRAAAAGAAFCPSIAFATTFAIYRVYRPPAVRFNGMSDGIGAVRRARMLAEQKVKSVGND